MLKTLEIKNFKSIEDLSLELGRINVFIGENGCGKTNILEALAMLAASKQDELETEELYNRGIRVAKPSITYSSFSGKKKRNNIIVSVRFEVESLACNLTAQGIDEVYARWVDRIVPTIEHKEIALEYAMNQSGMHNPRYDLGELDFAQFLEHNLSARAGLSDYLIYNITTKALRGIYIESRKLPLGINGEGIDVLISTFNAKERKKLLDYSYFISWLDNIVLDKEDLYKFKGHKLGKSTSLLYFKDRFMRQRNNIFSAENANEGILHVLFYLALFISKRTPALFGIDNIETSLNPQLCRTLMKELAKLAKESDKQALITTHNPAILDGMNLHDDDERLFVVYRSDEGDTRAKRIQLKPKVEVDGKSLKLSEMWMRGHLGGIPQNF